MERPQKLTVPIGAQRHSELAGATSATLPHASLPDADASDERIVELWLRDCAANTRVAYEREYARFRAFIGSRALRTVGLGDLSDFANTLTGSPTTRRRTLSAIKALLSTGFKMGALRFNVGAALRLPTVVSRRAERRLEEIELFKLLTALENHPRNRAIIEALFGTGARVDELAQLKRRQLVADLEGTGGYVTLYGKHGARRFASVRARGRLCSGWRKARSPMTGL